MILFIIIIITIIHKFTNEKRNEMKKKSTKNLHVNYLFVINKKKYSIKENFYLNEGNR